ncbi:MAG: hypothetical protein IID60_04340 [Proteobacteria bacterium]|nr:hypothetical protein [Pseudomonadota bacterium]
MKHTIKILLVIAGLVLSSASYAGYRGGGGHYGGGHHGGGNHVGSIAGAFIVGGLLGYAFTDYRYRAPRTVYRTVYVEPTTNQPNRSFRRESDGNCYLINYRENGDQVATIVPALNCE